MIFSGLRRLWIPLVVLVVIAAGGLTVSRLHGIFGSEKQTSYSDTRIDNAKPFNPKHVRYEVFGAPGTVADIEVPAVPDEPVTEMATEPETAEPEEAAPVAPLLKPGDPGWRQTR